MITFYRLEFMSKKESNKIFEKESSLKIKEGIYFFSAMFYYAISPHSTCFVINIKSSITISYFVLSIITFTYTSYLQPIYTKPYHNLPIQTSFVLHWNSSITG